MRIAINHKHLPKLTLWLLVSILTIFFIESCEELEPTNPADPSFTLKAPTLITAQAISDIRIDLTWQNNEEYTKEFAIQRKSGSESFSSIAVVSTGLLSFSDTTCLLGVSYSYVVIAKVESNQSAQSNVMSALTSFPAPSDMAITRIHDLENEIQWSDNCNFEIGYRLERDSGLGFELLAELGADITQFKDSDLNYDTDYSYRVVAYTYANVSNWAVSDLVSISYPAPSNINISPLNDSQLQIHWTDNTNDEDGFRIERDSGGGFEQIAVMDPNVVDLIDSGLNYSTSYVYRISGYVANSSSNWLTSSPASTIFPAPSSLSGSVINDSEIELNWVDNCGFEMGYRIERDSDNGYIHVGEVNSDVTQYIDHDLVYGIDYTYRVKAFSELNESNNSNERTVEYWQDCNDVWGGPATLDCNGDCEGTAYQNICDVCVGGDTGLNENTCDAEVIDFDDNVYTAVIIGDQVWMVQNLKVTHYRNGDPIPNVTGVNWDALTEGAYCDYQNGGWNLSYGRLYNWYAATDERDIAPEGWHVPTDEEWQALVDHLGGMLVAGAKLKETGWTHWQAPNEFATNESEFTAVAGGRRSAGNSSFWDLGEAAVLWSSTEAGESILAWEWSMRVSSAGVDRYDLSEKAAGASIRLIQN
jgi:uncharacterized protein (TIGR02145 family)